MNGATKKYREHYQGDRLKEGQKMDVKSLKKRQNEKKKMKK